MGDEPSSSFIPVIAGYGFLILLFTAAALSPRAWWVQELARRYGVQPSGPFGIYTRRDHVHRAALSLLASIGCFGCSMGAFAIMTRIPEYRPTNMVAAVYFFGFFLLSGVALLAALIALWQAIFYRRTLPPEPIDPLAWKAVADLLERLTVEPVPEPVWVAFAARRHKDPVLEHVRTACNRLCGGRPERFRGPLRTSALSWAAAIRAGAR